MSGGCKNANKLNGARVGSPGMQARRHDQRCERLDGRDQRDLRLRGIEIKRSGLIRWRHEADCAWLRTHLLHPDSSQRTTVRSQGSPPALEVARQKRGIN